MAATLLAAGSAKAAMIGDPVTGILHTAAAGSWSSGGSATVGPGIEFNKMPNPSVFLTLDIAAASFTLTYSNNATFGNFNEGIDGFEFTDLNQTFAGISLIPGNTFPNGTFTSTSVSANTIHIFMNEPVIPNGQTWTATWNVSFGSIPTPEPGTLGLLGLGGAALMLRRRRTLMRQLCICLGVLAGAISAQAQNAVSWVASTGSDFNTCIRTSPCRTFSTAYQKTNAGGAIQAIDAADYGPVGISKSITIDGSGTAAVIAAPALINGVSITNLGPSDQVALRHLMIYPAAAQSASTVYGISFQNASTALVNVEDVAIIMPSPSAGIAIGVGLIDNPVFSSQFTELNLRNVRISGGNYGAVVEVGNLTAERLAVTNSSVGLFATDCSITVRDSVFHNSLQGVNVSASTRTTLAMIERSEPSFNTTGLLVNPSGASATVRLSDSVVTGNSTGLSQPSGIIISFRTNMIAGNTTDGVPALTTSLK